MHMTSKNNRKRRNVGVGAGVAALVGLSVIGATGAHAATGFNPGSADARIGGADRYATAALIAQKNWPSARTVIVTNGETNGIDALSASFLAGAKDAPILLTRAGSVPTETLQAIAALNPAEVIVVGAEASVSTSAFNALTAGRATPRRIAGVDRFDTAAKLVAEGLASRPAGAPRPTNVFIARGDVYGDIIAADALAASPVAYRGGIPVLLTGQNVLPTATSDALKTLGASNVYALGSNLSVSDAVSQQAAQAAGGTTATRIQGVDRSGTAAAIASSQLATAAGFGKTSVGIANGYKVDALAAGPAAGKAGYPLLLAESATSLGGGTRAYLEANAANLISAQVFGDSASIAPSVTAAAATAGGGGASPTPGAPTAVTEPTAQAPADLDNQGDQPEVRVTFGLGNTNPGQITVQRVASGNANDVTAVSLAGQDLSSGSFIDYDVPTGSWIYRITTTGNAQQVAVASTQSPAVTLGAPAVVGQPTGMTVGSTSVRVTFNQAVSGLSVGEVTSSQGGLTLTPVAYLPTNGRSAVWDINVTGGTLSAGSTITIGLGSVSNAVGSTGPAAAFISAPIAAAPVVVGQPAGLRIGATTVRVTFSQPVSGFGPSDVSSNDVALGFSPIAVNAVDGLATTWDVSITGGPLGAGDTIIIASNGVQNVQGSSGPSAAFTSQAVVAAPAVVGQPSGVTVGSATVRVVFNQPVTGLAADEVSSSNNDLTFTPAAVSADGNGFATTWDLAIGGGTLQAGNTIIIGAGSVANGQGSTGPVGTFTSDPPDATPPTISSATVPASGVPASYFLVVSFTEAVQLQAGTSAAEAAALFKYQPTSDVATAVTGNSFQLANDGLSASIQVTVGVGQDVDTDSFTYTPTTKNLVDLAGNALGAVTAAPVTIRS
jgi:putative cell wall-binding protein